MDEDLWIIINNVIHSKTIEDLNKALKECLLVLESKNVNKRKFITLLNQQLHYKGVNFRIDALFGNNVDNIKNVHIHDYKDAPVIYALHRLIGVNKIIEYKDRLRKLSNLFDDEFEVSRTIGLKKQQVYDVLNYLQSKYSVFDVITCKTELEIFLFNNSHRDFNSMYEVFYEDNKRESYCNMYILTFTSRSEEHDPYQVLIHEIGHALQVALTHDTMSIPESFIEMNKVLDVHLENNTIIASDVFADVFSLVTMNKSYLAEHNLMISHFPKKALDFFEYYFDKLIKHALENKDVMKHKKVDIVWDIAPN